MNPEEWRPVPGWHGYYEVSSAGRVRSLTRVIDRPTGGTCIVYGRLLKQAVTQAGYMQVGLCREGGLSNRRVHRLVLLAFVGPTPEGMECCHGDGDKTNNHLSNLRWDTRSANHQDQVRHGTAHWVKSDECKRGHLLNEENTFIHATNGRRCCKACRTERAWRYTAERQEAPRRYPRLTVEVDNDRMNLYRQGLTDSEIGRLHGINRGSVKCWREARGLPANWNPTAPRRRQVSELAA